MRSQTCFSQHASHWSCLPFLYRTWTLQQCRPLSTSKSLPGQYYSPPDATSSRGGRSNNDRGGRTRRPSQRQFGRDRSAPSKAAQQIDERRLPFRTDYDAAGRVFRHIKQEGSNPDSTVTPKEYKAFQGLLALKQAASTNGASEEKGQLLNQVLEEAIGFKIIPQDPAEAQDERQEMERPAQAHLNRVKSLMIDARTDGRAWEILRSEVLDPLRDLVSGESDETLSSQEDDGGETIEHSSSDHQSANTVQDDKTLMQALPQHLINFVKVLSEHFPSSMHNIAILPYLHRQGSSIFTLGASTELYNAHLRELFRKHYDVAGMVKVLEEMHGRVYDFDGDTLHIVDTVLDEADSALEVHRSSAKAAFWGKEQMRGLRQELRQWRIRIEEQISERALQEARRREERALQQHRHDEEEGLGTPVYSS